jgi:hypothetical protein
MVTHDHDICMLCKKCLMSNRTVYLDVKASCSSLIKPQEDGNSFAETYAEAPKYILCM